MKQYNQMHPQNKEFVGRNTLIILVLLFIVTASVISAQTGIRSVDFKNFTYEPHCAGEDTTKVTVKNGSFSEEKQMEGYVDRFYFEIFATAYGDLDGDKQDEAIVLGVCNTGGTGNFSEGFVYKMRSGKPVLIERIEGGDRAYGGLKTAKIDGGFAFVERYDPGEHGASCCAELILTSKYKLTNGKLVVVGQPVKKDLYPKERVNFARGASGKTFNVTIPAGEGRRYVVGARAGQRLSASTDSSDAQLRLLEDARVTEGINNFLAVLPRSGDYTIEVRNNGDKDLVITLNIRID
jgi:hypothetical protein